MSNKSKKESLPKNTAKSPQKKTNLLPLFAVLAVAVCAAVVLLTGGKDAPAESEYSGAVTLSSGGSLVIPTADVTTDASFYPVNVDGTDMEILAVRDSAGNIRTAFNTCQVCYGSGRGYYVQSGDYLVCQNCGNRFSMDQVEIESGGCNPWPIFDENKTVTDDEISISYDFLSKAQVLFANWKVSY